nr:zinc finger, CCHC-type [Tanacetum cinerariifolium]
MPNRKKRKYGIRLMLSPRSAKAFFTDKGPDKTWQGEASRVSLFLGCKNLRELIVHLISLFVENQMAAAAQNTNNTTIRSILQHEKLIGPNFMNWYRNLRIVLRSEGRLAHLEQPLIPLPYPEVGQSVSSYLLKMKSYLDTLEYLGYAMPNELGVSLILNSLKKDYDPSIQNYNMHSMGKMIAELHVMLKLYKKGILKKAETLVVLSIREGKIQKNKKKPRGAKGKDKGKNKLVYAPKPKILPSPKRHNPAKDSVCHHCKEVGYWRRNFLSY